MNSSDSAKRPGAIGPPGRDVQKRDSRFFLLLLGTLALLAGLAGPAAVMTGCGSDEGSSDRHLILTGSSTVAPLMIEIGKRFEGRHPGTRVDVQTGGSSRGIADVRSGVADIGMVSRALRDDEGDLIFHTIARDGIAVIIHESNPVGELSQEDIVEVYRGRVGNWDRLGGPSRPITVVNKAEGRSTLELFLAHFGLDNADIQADVVIGDNEQGIKTVAGNPDAIGYVSIGAAEVSAENGVPIKILPLEGVPATTENVANGSFPLSRELNLVTRGEPSGPAAELIAFAQSEEVHDLIRQLNFVPLE